MAVLLCIPSLIGGQPPAYADEFEYNDVAKGSYAYNEIHYLYEKRIQTGDASGNFRPNESLTRAQAAVIMTNALGIGGSVSGQTFSDVRLIIGHIVRLNGRLAQESSEVIMGALVQVIPLAKRMLLSF